PYFRSMRDAMKLSTGALIPRLVHEIAESTRVVHGPSASARSVRQTVPTNGNSICIVISFGALQPSTLNTVFWFSPWMQWYSAPTSEPRAPGWKRSEERRVGKGWRDGWGGRLG